MRHQQLGGIIESTIEPQSQGWNVDVDGRRVEAAGGTAGVRSVLGRGRALEQRGWPLHEPRALDRVSEASDSLAHIVSPASYCGKYARISRPCSGVRALSALWLGSLPSHLTATAARSVCAKSLPL